MRATSRESRLPVERKRNRAKHHKAVGGLDDSGKKKCGEGRHNGVSVRLDNEMLSESGRIV